MHDFMALPDAQWVTAPLVEIFYFPLVWSSWIQFLDPLILEYCWSDISCLGLRKSWSKKQKQKLF